MTLWPPSDSATLARAVADAVVLKADTGARAANPYYWHRAPPSLSQVLLEVDACGDAALSVAVADLLADPQDRAGWEGVCALAAAVLDSAGGRDLGRAAWEVVATSRFGYHVGAKYDRTAVQGDGWRSWPAAAAREAA